MLGLPRQTPRAAGSAPRPWSRSPSLVRISYHLYYGWGVLPILAWALASVLVYRRYRRLWPFIVVHALWDLGLILAVLRRRGVGRRGPAARSVDVRVLAPVARPACRVAPTAHGRMRGGADCSLAGMPSVRSGPQSSWGVGRPAAPGPHRVPARCASRSSRSTAAAASAGSTSATPSPSCSVSRRTSDDRPTPSARSASKSELVHVTFAFGPGLPPSGLPLDRSPRALEDRPAQRRRSVLRGRSLQWVLLEPSPEGLRRRRQRPLNDQLIDRRQPECAGREEVRTWQAK